MKLLFVVRLVFWSLYVITSCIGLFILAVLAVFASDSPGCENGACSAAVLDQALVTWLPATVFLVAAWGLSEASIKTIVANREANPARFRFAMLAVATSCLLALLSDNIIIRTWSFRLLMVTAVMWSIVEIVRPFAKRLQRSG